MSPNKHTENLKQHRAHGIARLTVDIPGGFSSSASRETKEPLWSTLEFRFYYVVAVFAIPIMAWIPMTLSKSTHPNYQFYSSKLSPGWINGRLGNSDAQYRSFRDNLSVLCKAALGYLAIKYAVKRYFVNYLQLIPTNVALSLVMIVALHGTSAVKILVIMAFNYFIAKKCAESRIAPFLTWAFNILVLFANDLYSGYRFGDILPGLVSLDTFSGIYPRWHVGFNITMLRLICFNMDYYWACKKSETTDHAAFAQLSEKQRVKVPHKQEDYSTMNYIAYILYPPLYIAGPIITFNDFMWQHRKPLPVNIRSNIMYLVRFAFCYLTMECMLHYMYGAQENRRATSVPSVP